MYYIVWPGNSRRVTERNGAPIVFVSPILERLHYWRHAVGEPRLEYIAVDDWRSRYQLAVEH